MFSCQFPRCNFATQHRSKLDAHHITPREVVSNTKQTIYLCKNHHALIFHPEAKHGQHSINTLESIQILNIFTSTNGKVLHYQDYHNNQFYYFFDNKEIIAI